MPSVSASPRDRDAIAMHYEDWMINNYTWASTGFCTPGITRSQVLANSTSLCLRLKHRCTLIIYQEIFQISSNVGMWNCYFQWGKVHSSSNNFCCLQKMCTCGGLMLKIQRWNAISSDNRSPKSLDKWCFLSSVWFIGEMCSFPARIMG